MFYYTHHSDMDAPQYVHADVLSLAVVERMFYYTHYSDKGAPQYGNVDVPSDYFYH